MITSAFQEQWRSDFCAALFERWPSESALDIRAIAQTLPESWLLFPASEAARVVFDQWSHLQDEGSREGVQAPAGLSDRWRGA